MHSRLTCMQPPPAIHRARCKGVCMPAALHKRMQITCTLNVCARRAAGRTTAR